MEQKWYENWRPDGALFPGEGVLIAVSGGADSVALVRLLKDAASDMGLRLCCAHFEHGIRGEDSRADAAFVRRLCQTLGLELVMESADVPALTRMWGMGLEQAARQARYDFFFRVMKEKGLDALALGHHMDDQAESVLMHLFRGCGVHGLRGMEKRSGVLARPLLDLRKDDLMDYLRDIGQDWREDLTNAQLDTPRNILRHQLMPPAQRAYPGAVAAVARLAALARADDDCLNEQARAMYRARAHFFCGGVRLEAGEDCPNALLSRMIQRALAHLELPGEAETLWRIMERPKTLDIQGGGRAQWIRGTLYLTRAEKQIPPPQPLRADAHLPGIGWMRMKRCAPEPIRQNGLTQVLNARALEGACLRTRQAGDRIHPLGASGSQLLSDYLINRKIPQPLRDALPLVAKNDRILWVVGVGIGQEAAVCPGDEALRLQFEPERPSDETQNDEARRKQITD